MPGRPLLLPFALLALAVNAGPAPAGPPVSPDHAEKMARGQELFAKQVRELLVANCVKCHGGDKTRGGLDLTTREALLKGGDKGPVAVVGEGKKSKLYRLAAHLDTPHMPPKAARLSESQLAGVAAWIDLGAPYDRPLTDKVVAGKKPMSVTEEDRQFWSFRPLTLPQPPAVKNAAWVRTPVDRFVLAKLEAKGIVPNGPAERRKLIRRAAFDLTGLPPTPEEVEAFVHDPDPAAYDKLLDRLLASSAYGERWARHWLDLARYAESHGYEQDYDRPHAYPYRDFVIKALNQDLPYDTFVRWQLAGDELEPDNPLALMATGFLAAGVHSTQITKNQVEKERYDELDDMTRTVGTAFLGLTVGCARCHDHKYDPIPTRDYYRLLSTFTTTVRSDYDVDLDPKATRAAKARYEAEHAPLVAALSVYEHDELPKKLGAWLASHPRVAPAVGAAGGAAVAPRAVQGACFRAADPGRRRLAGRVAEHAKSAPKPNVLKALISSEGVPAVRNHTQGGDFLEKTYFLKRGDPNQKDEVATQGFLQVVMRAPDGEKHWQAAPPPGWRTSYRRRALAAWVTDVGQGAGHLLARVIVNRLWQHHFGRGIVATPSDFGQQGERPTHPELLDWLASELVRGGWKLKPMHKLLMRSAAYLESSDSDAARAAADPDNKFLWRRVPRRLEAEAIRDALLAMGGTLDRRMYGPGTLDPNQKRRSIYFFVKRSQLVPSMTLFDGPDTLQATEQRQTTTVAPQALLLMNNVQVRACAEAMARRLGADRLPEEAVRAGYVLALGRPPTAAEQADSSRFVCEQADSYKADGKPDAATLALADWCQVLMELNEFVYVD